MPRHTSRYKGSNVAMHRFHVVANVACGLAYEHGAGK